jgi:hypothetical protein
MSFRKATAFSLKAISATDGLTSTDKEAVLIWVNTPLTF